MVFLTCEVRDKLASVSVRRGVVGEPPFTVLLICPSVAEFFRRKQSQIPPVPEAMSIRLTDHGILEGAGLIAEENGAYEG